MAGGWCAAFSALLWDPAADQRCVCRFAQHDASLGSFAPEHAGNTSDCSAGPVACDEDIQALTGKVIDDFTGGRALMNVCVGLSLKLPSEKPPMRLRELNRLLIHAEALLRSRSQYDLGTEHAHQLASLHGEAVGHCHNKWVALLGANHGKPDSSIAACRLDQRLPRAKRAGALCRLDHVQGEPVLDRRGRVKEFGLDINCPALNSEIIDPDHRGVADGIQDAVEKAATTPCASDVRCSRHNDPPVCPPRHRT